VRGLLQIHAAAVKPIGVVEVSTSSKLAGTYQPPAVRKGERVVRQRLGCSGFKAEKNIEMRCVSANRW
jgi:hypothetical protein